MMTAHGVHPLALRRVRIPIRLAALILQLVLSGLAAEHRRALMRRDLDSLASAEDHVLRDLGLTRMEVQRLITRPTPR